MSITNVTKIFKKEVKELDFKINIRVRDMDLSKEEYVKEIRRLGSESTSSSIAWLLRGLADIIEDE